MNPGIRPAHLLEHVIRPTLGVIGLESEAAEQLLLGTAAVESRLGSYLVQVGGPALGIYQIEPATHRDVWESWLNYKKPLADRVRLTMTQGGIADEMLVGNLCYATAIARVIYRRRKEPLPQAGDLFGLAAYWKAHYNTHAGKGRIEDFVTTYRRMVLDS